MSELSSQDPSKVKAVLDWELSTLGDPLADAAYGVMAHHIPSDFRFVLFEDELKSYNLKLYS